MCLLDTTANHIYPFLKCRLSWWMWVTRKFLFSLKLGAKGAYKLPSTSNCWLWYVHITMGQSFSSKSVSLYQTFESQSFVKVPRSIQLSSWLLKGYTCLQSLASVTSPLWTVFWCLWSCHDFPYSESYFFSPSPSSATGKSRRYFSNKVEVVEDCDAQYYPKTYTFYVELILLHLKLPGPLSSAVFIY